MGGKQAMLLVLLVLTAFNILSINGEIICPWCVPNMQSRLLECMYAGAISQPQLLMISLRDIETLRLRIASYSDSIPNVPYGAKKLKVDKKFTSEMANLIKGNKYEHDPVIINVISDLGGNCYSSVTGYDPNVVSRDIKAMVNEEIKKDEDPLRRYPSPAPNSRMPYAANQNQKSNSQPFRPPLINTPFNPPGILPKNSFGNPPFDNPPFTSPGLPPKNSFGNPPFENPPFTSPGLPPRNSFDNPPFENPPFTSPGFLPKNSFGKPLFENPPFNSPGLPPTDSFGNPLFGSKAALNPTVSPPMNPPRNPSSANNAGNRPSNDFEGQSQATTDLSKNKTPSSGPQGSSFVNDKQSQGYRNSPNNGDLVSTTSPKVSSPSQGSKSTDSDSSDNSNWTTPSPNVDASQKKTTENKKSDDEEPCDEKFKIALSKKLMNDDIFCSFFHNLPASTTKPEVPKIMHHAFKEYGIEQHFTEFSTFWEFESKTLNKESTVGNWVEVMSKISKIIFSRNDLLKGDCGEAGEKLACYILDTFPEDPAASSTENTNQNNGKDETSTETDSNSSLQKAKPATNSTANASAENNSNPDNSTNLGNLSFPELHSKLANIFNDDGSANRKNEKVPFSEMLTAFETQENLEKLHSAADSCASPSRFDFDGFSEAISDVIKSIQSNHPDWSRDKCEREAYSEAVAVLTKKLQDTLASNNNNTKIQSPSTDSVEDASDSQNSNSGAQPGAPNNYEKSSDDPTYPGPGNDFVSGSAPQQQQGFINFGDYADVTGPVNIPPSGNQPEPGSWNTGPSIFAPGPVNTNYRDSANENPQNAPFSQPRDLDYPEVPPATMDTQPYYGTQPLPKNPNAGFQQSPDGNFRSNQFQARDFGNDRGFNSGSSDARPMLPNDNSRMFPSKDYDSGFPSAGPMLPNDNSRNFRSKDYDSSVPAAGPMLPIDNSRNFRSKDYDSSVPAAGPMLPNYNTQPQFNSNYNSRNPVNGPVIPRW